MLNRTAQSGNENTTPYELWYGRWEVIHHLRDISSPCLVKIPEEQRRKLDAKVIEGVLIGYSEDHDGYRIWIPSRHAIVRSTKVKIMEAHPPET